MNLLKFFRGRGSAPVARELLQICLLTNEEARWDSHSIWLT